MKVLRVPPPNPPAATYTLAELTEDHASKLLAALYGFNDKHLNEIHNQLCYLCDIRHVAVAQRTDAQLSMNAYTLAEKQR